MELPIVLFTCYLFTKSSQFKVIERKGTQKLSKNMSGNSQTYYLCYTPWKWLSVILSLRCEEPVLKKTMDNMTISETEVCSPVCLLHAGNYEEEYVDPIDSCIKKMLVCVHVPTELTHTTNPNTIYIQLKQSR